ncbi:hypothetical protein ACE41H_14780 [Paenibacillus enshidis]|uniref:Uncharacterized protein n=1 Tax=Paenibacillus enshidis TaxID=1458439 RepID=A0ABV5AX95_9BACL
MRQAPKEAGAVTTTVCFPGSRREAVAITAADERSSEFCALGKGRGLEGNLPPRQAQMY